jgi:hypothetical protein
VALRRWTLPDQCGGSLRLGRARDEVCGQIRHSSWAVSRSRTGVNGNALFMRYHSERQPEQAEIAAAGGAGRRPVRRRGRAVASIARSAPCGAAAPLPRGGRVARIGRSGRNGCRAHQRVDGLEGAGVMVAGGRLGGGHRRCLGRWLPSTLRFGGRPCRRRPRVRASRPSLSVGGRTRRRT